MWEDAINNLKERRTAALEGGGKSRIEKQHHKGKLTARERLEYLFDNNSFTELDGFIEGRINDFNLDKKRAVGDGVVTGYGKINGRLVFAASEDFTVIGGTLGEYHSLKICRLQDMALEAGAPIIFINDSGGARIEEGISSLSGYSGIFLRNTRASGIIPQIAVIAGPCSGGACYSPAICDFIFMVEKTSNMFITGPSVVKSVINEDTTPDELGGSHVHASISGVSHFTYADERSCLDGVKKLLEYLPSHAVTDTDYSYKPLLVRAETHHKDFSYKIQDIIPDNPRKPYDVRNVINAIIDEGSFLEVQQHFAANVVIGFSRFNGCVTGIVANQPKVLSGSLDCDSSDKMARFIRFCDCFSIPLVTLIDVPAFMPGTAQEHSGIIRHGAKVLFAYSEASVPKISLIMRKAYGGAYIAMNSKEMGADIVYAFPIAEIAVMGSEGAVNIIFKKDIEASENPDIKKAELKKAYDDKFMNPYIAASRGYVDEVILPSETRQRILSALEVLKEKKTTVLRKKHGNIPL